MDGSTALRAMRAHGTPDRWRRPSVCRVCLFAWGHYATVILRGLVVREAGGVQLRHAGHDYPMPGCPLCRTDRLRGAPSFDGWLHGRNA